MFIQGVFFNWDPPKSHKCQPVSKFWHFHFTRFWYQHVASRIYALLSVIRQQMSPFDPFRVGSPKVDNVPFFYRFSYTTASLNWRGERKTSEERVEVWLQLSPIEQCVDCVMQGFAPFVSSSHHVQKVDIFKTVFGSIQTQEKSITKQKQRESLR